MTKRVGISEIRISLYVIALCFSVFLFWVFSGTRNVAPDLKETPDQQVQRYRDERDAKKAAEKRSLMDVYICAQTAVIKSGKIPSHWRFLPYEEVKVEKWGYELKPDGSLDLRRRADDLWYVETFAYDPHITKRIVFRLIFRLRGDLYSVVQYREQTGWYFGGDNPERLKFRGNNKYLDFDWQEYRRAKEKGLSTKWD